MKSVLLLLCLLLTATGATRLNTGTRLDRSAAAEFSAQHRYRGDRVFRHAKTNAYYFVTRHMALNADGAPNAYHPKDAGLDYLANAGYPNHRWWKNVLVQDPKRPNRPYVQKKGRYKGYYLSKTALVDPNKGETNPKCYVSATDVPYLVLPRGFRALGWTGDVGELGVAVNRRTGARVAFIVGDIGPDQAPLGEVSLALAKQLGGKNPNPGNGAGAPTGEFLYLVFPNSAQQSSWPLSQSRITAMTHKLVRATPGLEKVLRAVHRD